MLFVAGGRIRASFEQAAQGILGDAQFAAGSHAASVVAGERGLRGTAFDLFHGHGKVGSGRDSAPRLRRA